VRRLRQREAVEPLVVPVALPGEVDAVHELAA
jgi:hypothetical protein